ncbi:hypothetical protein [Streptomyces acidiscabies]|uniref:Uncharacterized protein n=1 Tax=Streptomyces acidiscabies TaxID=42234 RepID=A0AAP6EHK4_9ACTN|nr:hypothetical protein [Streptomyces acidiscabies]MBZ3913247.1 hypothetical protein [Streptomyces acidiscabies]MDX2962943.1 hypothetical protein [Streptomyces acidiscabies]MDX3021454.1 hypothetical protein [Streptomyces acidiscabies]MDX3790212.1 hypothetical protein [Streptomyces acidiscabies]
MLDVSRAGLTRELGYVGVMSAAAFKDPELVGWTQMIGAGQCPRIGPRSTLVLHRS